MYFDFMLNGSQENMYNIKIACR